MLSGSFFSKFVISKNNIPLFAVLVFGDFQLPFKFGIRCFDQRKTRNEIFLIIFFGDFENIFFRILFGIGTPYLAGCMFMICRRCWSPQLRPRNFDLFFEKIFLFFFPKISEKKGFTRLKLFWQKIFEHMCSNRFRFTRLKLFCLKFYFSYFLEMDLDSSQDDRIYHLHHVGIRFFVNG